ncbi:ParB/RepB/Spo0J family partition protein [Litorisediminicola beolgyonensis]|uniref:ParB/RepB/Spo0J family partition protein n=1 Tax=Litorisediminicola beolgyonensis TaxID=1173614 RepID=A0ABW3ZNN6_9RHOB
MAKRKRLDPPVLHRLSPFADPAPESAPDGTRGPAFATPERAAPIADIAGAASASAALEEISDTLRRARDEGRMIVELPLNQIIDDHLIRDRMHAQDDDMEALEASLLARGQQTPIEVVQTGPEAYGLISGWRRLEALKRLSLGKGDARFRTVKALVRPPSESAESYLAMVEENEIRADLSFYERARIVILATRQGVFPDTETALNTLFASVPRARRSKIRSFLVVVQALDGVLRFPEALTERLGLQLMKALDEDAGFAERLRAAGAAEPPADAGAERARIEACLEAQKQALKAETGSKNPGKRRMDAGGGITLVAEKGKLTLRGRVDATLEADLLDWLRARGA